MRDLIDEYYSTECGEPLPERTSKQELKRIQIEADHERIQAVVRDSGAGYMQLDDGSVCHQQDYIRRRCHSKAKDNCTTNDTDWFMVIYVICWTVVVSYLSYELYPAFVALYHSIFN